MTNNANTIRKELPVNRDLVEMVREIQQKHVSGETVSVKHFEELLTALKEDNGLSDPTSIEKESMHEHYINDYADAFSYTVNFYKAALNLGELNKVIAIEAMMHNPRKYGLWQLLLEEFLQDDADAVKLLLTSYLEISQERNRELLSLIKSLYTLEFIGSNGIVRNQKFECQLSFEEITQMFIGNLLRDTSEEFLRKAVWNYLHYETGGKSDLEEAEIYQNFVTKDVVVLWPKPKRHKVIIPLEEFQKSFLKVNI